MLGVSFDTAVTEQLMQALMHDDGVGTALPTVSIRCLIAANCAPRAGAPTPRKKRKKYRIRRNIGSPADTARVRSLA